MRPWLRSCYAFSMARKRTPRSSRPPKDPGEAVSLIDWRDPAPNADVLDWRRRAQEFGLGTGDDAEEAAPHSSEAPDRLLREEDAEAFEEQPIGDAEGEDPKRQEGDTA